MTHLPLRRAFPFVLVLSAVSACGGGGGGNDRDVFRASVPDLSNDFADFATGGETYSASARFVRSDGSLGDVVTLDLDVRSANDGSGDIIVSEGGSAFRLVRQPSGDYAFTGPSGGIFADGAFGDDVGALLIVAEGVTEASAGFVVFGRDSTDVGIQRGKAVYLGPSAFLAVSENGRVNGGSGGFILEADFESSSVDGVIALTEASTSTAFQIGFEDAPIVGNGFSSTRLVQRGLNGTVTSSNLDGAFYGRGAGEVGGTYTMDLDSGGETTWIAGALLGSRQAGDLDDIRAAGGEIDIGGGERITLGSGSLVGGSGSVYPDGSSTYYNSNTGVSFGADGGGCYYVGDWSNC